MHYTPIPTLPYPHPGIHIHIHTSSHPPITPSLTHPYNILDVGICPPIQQQPHNISMSLICCNIDRSHSPLCISIYTRTGEGKRPMEGGGREEREGWEWDVCVRGGGVNDIFMNRERGKMRSFTWENTKFYHIFINNIRK